MRPPTDADTSALACGHGPAALRALPRHAVRRNRAGGRQIIGGHPDGAIPTGINP